MDGSARLLLILSAACSYGAALTLNLFHHIGVEHVEGETPVGVLVLRDGTLALPLLAFVAALVLPATLRRTSQVTDLTARAGLAGAVVGVALAATLAAAGPVHEALFGGHGHDHGLLGHVLLSFIYAAVATLPLSFVILRQHLGPSAPAVPAQHALIGR